MVVLPAPTTPMTITIMAGLFLSVRLLDACTGVCKAEAAVGLGCDLEIFPFAVLLHVRDVVRINIVVLVRSGRVVKLPKVFQSGGIVYDLPARGAGALARTIIEDRDPWMQCPNHGLGIRGLTAMMGYKEKVNRPKNVAGTRQFQFLLLRQIAEIEETELAVGNQNSYRPRILRRIIRGCGLRLAIRICLSCSGQ